jgi:hypothetical protein
MVAATLPIILLRLAGTVTIADILQSNLCHRRRITITFPKDWLSVSGIVFERLPLFGGATAGWPTMPMMYTLRAAHD